MGNVGIVFSGGPAPGANAVIAAVSSCFRRAGWDVVGFLHGYGGLVGFDPGTGLREGEDYIRLQDRDLWGLRNAPGVLLGTDRVHPGRAIRSSADLTDANRTQPLANVCAGIRSLGIDALVSIGGDGTLMTANFLHRWQALQHVEPIRIAHVPKTIDNDYQGIDFTFGFFTAVDVIARELRNLREDARATRRVYVAECMGRDAGWLAYGAAVAGEAHLVLGLEDLARCVDAEGQVDARAVAREVVQLARKRWSRGKRYAVVVLAEGLAIRSELGSAFAERVAALAEAELTDDAVRVVSTKLGYEARCAAPHAFDVLLGTQLGVGAYKALAEDGLDGVMVSIEGQLQLRCVPFSDLVDDDTMRTRTRFIDPDSDFFQLAKLLQTRV